MAGLLPDFSNEINEERSDALLRFSYDNTLEEIDGAMATFQQRYTGKKHKIMLVAYIDNIRSNEYTSVFGTGVLYL